MIAWTSASGARAGHRDRRVTWLRGNSISNSQMAVERSGAALAAWTERAAGGGSRARVAARAARGAFSAGQPVSRPGANATSVALTGRTAFVAWQRAGRVEGRRSRDGGCTWGATQLLGRVTSRRTHLSVAVSRRGAVAVAWMHQELTEGGEHGPAIAAARLRAPGRGFGAPARLERHEARAPEQAEPVIMRFSGERALVAWQGLGVPSGADRPRFAVRSAEVTPFGLEERFTLSAPSESAALEALATRGSRAAASWRAAGFEGGAGEIRASVTGESGWQAGEVVATRGRDSQLAWGAGGRLEAVWVAPAGDRAVVHAATR